jgi:hypothetical protein
MILPDSLEAGAPFTVSTSGNGKATLYVVGPGAAIKQDIQLGGATAFPAGSLSNVGHYVACLAWDGGSINGVFDVSVAAMVTELSFLAKPSRLSVGVANGITGTVYLFDVYHNLILPPATVSFELLLPSGSVVKRTAVSRGGAAWIALDSSAQQGNAKFSAQVGTVSSTRIVEQVPGDPCRLAMSAKQVSGKLELVTEPVKDCSGNPVPDGTIVTFTGTHNGDQSTVDVPLKHGVAQGELPAYPGEALSVASGVVLGNRIVWEK